MHLILIFKVAGFHRSGCNFINKDTPAHTARKKKFSIQDFFSKCDQIRRFTKEILNGKLDFLCSHKCDLLATACADPIKILGKY